MTTKTPVVRQTSWLMVIPQLIVLLVCVGISAALLWSRLGLFSVSVGALIYLLYSIISRRILTRHHRRGMNLTFREEYQPAIAEYERSYDFFSKNAWVDNYRAITMMTPAAMSFREMALINIAYCYRKLGDVKKSKAAYERALREFPNSQLARSGLDNLENRERSIT